MKKLYLVNTLGTREFWTVDDENMILRSLYNDESVDAEDCDDVEDDSSWDEKKLTAEELEHLFDDVEIVDERLFDNKYCVTVEIGTYIHTIEHGEETFEDKSEYHVQDKVYFVDYDNAKKMFDEANLDGFHLEARRESYKRISNSHVISTREEEFALKTLWVLDEDQEFDYAKETEERRIEDDEDDDNDDEE